MRQETGKIFYGLNYKYHLRKLFLRILTLRCLSGESRVQRVAHQEFPTCFVCHRRVFGAIAGVLYTILKKFAFLEYFGTEFMALILFCCLLGGIHTFYDLWLTQWSRAPDLILIAILLQNLLI